jgi:hypothetical protein
MQPSQRVFFDMNFALSSLPSVLVGPSPAEFEGTGDGPVGLAYFQPDCPATVSGYLQAINFRSITIGGGTFERSILITVGEISLTNFVASTSPLRSVTISSKWQSGDPFVAIDVSSANLLVNQVSENGDGAAWAKYHMRS